MAFPKGKPNPNAGRRKGIPNVATLQGREALAKFVEGNAHRLESWLEGIAKTNPLAAFNAFMSVCEYHLPKLQRTEVTGKDGKDLYLQMTDEQMLARLQSLVAMSRGLRQQPEPLPLASHTIDDSHVHVDDRSDVIKHNNIIEHQSNEIRTNDEPI